MYSQALENIYDALEMHVAEVPDELCTLLVFQIDAKVELGPSVHSFSTTLELFVCRSVCLISSIVLPTFRFCLVRFGAIVYVTKARLAEQSIDRFVKLIVPVLIRKWDDANRHKLCRPTRGRLQ